VCNVPDAIFGLPTHILVVHAAVVLIPLAAVGAVVMALSARWSERFGPAVVAVGAVGFLASLASRLSGPSLAQSQGVSEAHHSAGNLLPFFAAGLLIVVTVLWLIDRRGAVARSLSTSILAVVVVAVAVLATGWTIRTGHTGSEQVWQNVVTMITSPQHSLTD